MDFPEQPSYGMEVVDTESSGRTWKWDGEKWILVGALLTDIDFEADSPVTVAKTVTGLGERGGITYGLDMSKLDKINPN